MAELLTSPTPPKELLDKLFGSYKGLDNDDPSSYILISNNPKVEPFVRLAEACHADMRYAAANTWDQLITAVPRTDELSLAYIRMLLQGPYRGLSCFITLKQSDGNWYLHATDLDQIPAKALYNFCIASRVPIEYKEHLPFWDKLVKQGYNSVLAYLLSWSNDGKELKPGKSRSWYASNHMWFSNTSDWNNIINANMIGLEGNFRSLPGGAAPCNIIWGESQDAAKLSTMTELAIAEYFGLPPVLPEPKRQRRTRQKTLAQAAAVHLDIEAVPQPAGHWADHFAQFGEPVIVNGPPPANPWANVPLHHPGLPAGQVNILAAGAQPAHILDDDDDDFPDDDFPDMEPDFDIDDDDI